MTNWRSFSALGSLLALLLTPPAPVRAEESLPGCRAALAPATYDGLLALPVTTIERIEEYREGWRRLCAGERGNISLYDLLVQARQIERDFEPIFRREGEIFGSTKDQGEAWRRAEEISRLFVTKLPAFIPGFQGSFVEWAYFQPSIASFREHRSLGDEEDRFFLGSEIGLPGSGPDPNPWFEYTWDYGGCYRFGEFDWVAEIRRIEDLRDQLHRELYRSALAEYERSLYKALTPRSSRCVCKDADSALPDLEKVSRFLARHGEREETRGAIDHAAAQIRAGAVSLPSSRDGGCGGG